MSKNRYTRLAEVVRPSDPTIILRAADRCDGHTIFKPEAFLDAGLPNAVVDHLTRSHRSDGSPKGTIFVSGRPVNELRGIYGLDALRFIAGALGFQCEPKIGRGSEAQSIQRALRKHFKDAANARPAP